jgi:hypothetical protein
MVNWREMKVFFYLWLIMQSLALVLLLLMLNPANPLAQFILRSFSAQPAAPVPATYFSASAPLTNGR